MKDIQGIVDLSSAFYGSAVLFAAIDCGVFEKVERGELDTGARGMRLLADACVALGLLDARGNGSGAISPTLTGDHQNRVTDYTAIVVEAPEKAERDN